MINKIELKDYKSNNVSLIGDELYYCNDLIMYQNKGVIKLYNDSFGDIEPYGNILFVGIGFGLLYNNWKYNENIKSFTGIDCNEDVISMNKYIGNDMIYHCVDAYEFKSDEKYDIICLDIFHNKPNDYEYKQKNLMNLYSKYLNDGGLLSYLKIHNKKITL